MARQLWAPLKYEYWWGIGRIGPVMVARVEGV